MLPQLSTLYDEADEAFDYAERYASTCEAQLCAVLRRGGIPPPSLQEAIAVAKVRSVETVIQLCFRLKQAVGSHALMVGSGFEHLDGMQIAKFAEGESFVLMQKLARDRVRHPGAADSAADAAADAAAAASGGLPPRSEQEEALAAELRTSRAAEWLAKAGKVYLLAELVMDRKMEQLVGAPLPRGIARPFARL